MRTLISAKAVRRFCHVLMKVSHVLSSVSSRLDEFRYRLIDDACGCENCEGRRAKGYQNPQRFF